MSNDEQVHAPEVVQRGSSELALTGTANITELRARMAQMKEMIELKREFLRDNLKEGIDKDYAVIPGTNKNSLLKPGAEKLTDWHGYYASFELTEQKEDWGIGLFAFTYRCTIKQKGTNLIVGDCEGDCSTYESKYRYEWKYEKDVPTGIDITTLKKKNFGTDQRPRVKYFVPTENGADKRNTVRKMAQKRAFIGATVLATASSDLFTSEEPPDPDEDGAGGTGGGQGATGKKANYGDPISEAQGKRLWAIRSSHKIERGDFDKWLKAKYGLDSDKKIGKNIYEEICKACESGHLDMPKVEAQPAEAATAQPESDKPKATADGAKLSVPQIKAINDEMRKAKYTESVFMDWLGSFEPKYKGLGLNDILAADFDRIIMAFVKCAEAGTL